MKRFLNLVITNMANVLMPIIILSLITVIIQVGIYSFNLVTREDYKENVNVMEDADNQEVICKRPVEFITETEEVLFYTLMLITVVAGVFLTGFRIREKNEILSVFRMLPVKRITLFCVSAASNILSVLGIYLVNLTSVALCYIIYNGLVHIKFREAKLDRIDGLAVGEMIMFLIIFTVPAVVMTIVYYKKAYSIKGKKRGDKNE